MRSQDEEKLHTALNELLLFHLASEKKTMARYKLRRVRFYMLRHLYQNPGISITRLGVLSFTDAGSTSRIVFGFEQEGLVQRQSESEDRRMYTLSLTDAGKVLYEEVDTALRDDIQKRFSSFNTDQLNEYINCVQGLSSAIKESILSE